MGYDIDMFEYYDEQQHKKINKPFLSFKRKNLISCKRVTFWSVIWNYICTLKQRFAICMPKICVKITLTF